MRTMTTVWISCDDADDGAIMVWDKEPTDKNNSGDWIGPVFQPLMGLHRKAAARMFPVLPERGKCIVAWTGHQDDARAFMVDDVSERKWLGTPPDTDALIASDDIWAATYAARYALGGSVRLSAEIADAAVADYIKFKAGS